MTANASGSFYVPHDIEAPIAGSASGPLAGLFAAVKDLYDIAGSRTGGGSPEWLAAQQPARAHAAAVEKILSCSSRSAIPVMSRGWAASPWATPCS